MPARSVLEGGSLTTERLLLRPLVESDAEALFAVFSDPVVTRFWSTPPWEHLDQARRTIAAEREPGDGTSVRLAVVRRDTDALVGTFSLFALERDSRRAEIGYALVPAVWGQGLAREAGRAMVDHAFDVVGLHRLEADIDPRNTASERVLLALGFRREGLLRERWIVAGEVSDSALFGLLRSDRAPAESANPSR